LAFGDYCEVFDGSDDTAHNVPFHVSIFTHAIMLQGPRPIIYTLTFASDALSGIRWSPPS
jgi:hypothetical protein